MAPTAMMAAVSTTAFTLILLLQGAATEDVAGGVQEDSRLMTLVEADAIGDADMTAFQTASGGGTLKMVTEKTEAATSTSTFLLTMNKVSNSTAILSNMYSPETGAKAAPLDVIHDKLPKFALLFINKNPPHHTGATVSEHEYVADSPDYMVIGLDLQELDMILDNSLLSDDDAAGSSSITLRYRCTMQTMPNMLGAANLTVPLHFTEAALLIDLIKYDDMAIPKAKRDMTLGHMASTGELAYNMQKHLSQQGNWKDSAFQAQAQGIMTIGWIPGSWSLWAWICCPAWLLTCPICTVTVLLCCV